MLLTNPHHDAIIKLLVKHHHLTINELHTQLGQSQISISLANLYRIIQTLIQEYVLIKKNGALQLHHTRVTELIDLAGRVQALQDTQLNNLLQLGQGERLTIQTSSLLSLETQRVDLIFQLNLHVPSPDGYFWYNEHAFFTFGMPEIEADAGNKLATPEKPVWGIIGSDTAMDRRAITHKNTSRKHEKVIPHTIRSKTPGYCLNIYGDRIIEFVMPAQLLVFFKVYFDNISDIALLDTKHYRTLFETKAHCTLTIRRDHQEARKLTDMIKTLINS